MSLAVTQAGAAPGLNLVVDQDRDDVVAGIEDFNLETSFSADFSGVYDNATSRVRWTGVRIRFDGSDLHPTAYYGRVSEEESMTPGQARTMRFSPIGPLWTMPTNDYEAPAGSGAFDTPPGSDAPPSSPPESPPVTAVSPRSWGNKDVELHLSFGASPRSMVETMIFAGKTLQKSNRGDVVIEGDITATDHSIDYANIPLCYQIPPFGGKTRGQILTDLALSVGVPLEKIHVPVGGTVTKPILLSNASLLPIANELGAPENWFVYFDENKDFVVEVIDLKDEPDFTIDARRGDYDFDTTEEQLPAMAPTVYYVTGTVPFAGGAGGSTSAIAEGLALYNPKTIKVRPSGGPTILQSDGSYRALAAPERMVVSRAVTSVTTLNGLEVTRETITSGMYNPLRYDPNFDTSPPGTSYDGAYGDHTFHRDEVESLMEVGRDTTTVNYDTNGTPQRRVREVKGWIAPKRAGHYSADRKTVTNLAGVCFVFPGGTTRQIAEERYDVISRTEQSYSFGPDGVRVEDDLKEFGWDAPKSRCDVFPQSVTDSPPDPSDPTPPAFAPSLVGPIGANGMFDFLFTASAHGIPTGRIGDNSTATILTLTVQPGGWQTNSSNTYDWVPSGPSYEYVAGPYFAAWPGGYGNLENLISVFAQPPGGTVAVEAAQLVFQCEDTNGVLYSSQPVFFDSSARVRGSYYNYP